MAYKTHIRIICSLPLGDNKSRLSGEYMFFFTMDPLTLTSVPDFKDNQFFHIETSKDKGNNIFQKSLKFAP